MMLTGSLENLSRSLNGELFTDEITRTAYSSDASVYSEKPVAVAWPTDADDIRKLLDYCRSNGTGLTMRAAGTSLAGQAVGKGIVADISRHMNRIIDFNREGKWIEVEPGVVLDELNLYLKPHGLFFAPETSTSSRCTIGGMVGNNACGLHSLVYGSTREHLRELTCILSDGSEAIFGEVDASQFNKLCEKQNLEGNICRNLRQILSDPLNRKIISEEFPHREITRRNTGYCLDLLLDTDIFSGNGKPFNISALVAGSEGTLAIVTRIKLNLVPLPPPFRALLCVHLKERDEAFRANLIALRFKPAAVEMMDNRILRLTENNLSQRNNRFFITGEPGAILIIEINGYSDEEIAEKASLLTGALKAEGFGYNFPLITGNDIGKVWELRKAGLGVLSNMKGDARPVSLIEDTAVRPADLPDYMNELTALLDRFGKDVVLHAHIGTGELHVRPVMDLREERDRELFRKIGLETAGLVRKYRGSLSGEHGDGRLRSEFIPVLLGEHNYSLLRSLKETWDPLNILNPGIKVNASPIDLNLRYGMGPSGEPDTFMDFSLTGGIIRAAEKCSGSADCRKSYIIGGTMCPSYMATHDERLSTRARANILRQYLPEAARGNWNQPEIHEILDLCLSCKGCKGECPSGVDIAKIKAEFLQHWNDLNGISLRTWLIAHITSINKLGSLLPALFNRAAGSRIVSKLVRRIAGIAPGRSIPALHRVTLTRWLKRNLSSLNPVSPVSEVCLFIDEFTEYNDTETGIMTFQLLTSLNYRVLTVGRCVSGRTFISKGFIRKAASIAERNVTLLYPMAARGIPVIGIEPSAILSFRDEYPDLVRSDLKPEALSLAEGTFTVEEFIVSEFRSGRITREMFTDDHQEILVHVHCQQKALSDPAISVEALSIPSNYRVREIPSGCCGMAGSFGYEKEHFDLSNRIGELVLFPEVRSASASVLIAAPGTSCRHHIHDGTEKKAVHPAVILYRALIK